ncbi:MAG: alanine racemase [Candidatus Eisenbacteria bacterium]|uniref:Alanine racemase n=1 Tax=Eiseniibacteriota bacterium TaxID=2212470 RepID=A0A948RRB2_UNCEI|nr:alanine racemase [Candidatus Eisenbacteria bacterium]MBU1949021.1 alanine racemase [Candidatus Eisenbacteria bacterium]MBU2689445.1 alanine racemase [Candidatus Eisenbacteria bacterium]
MTSQNHATPSAPSLSWLEIDAGAYQHNLAEFRRLIGPDRKLMAVVKANAYGHGLEKIAPLALRFGADRLGVNSLNEALELLALELSAPIHLLGPIPMQALPAAAGLPLEFTLSTFESLQALARGAGKSGIRPQCHIKVETGCHRQGFMPEEIPSVARFFADHSELQWSGLSTHFANIEDTTDHTYARRQIEIFHKVERDLHALGIQPLLRHTACSAATIVMPETHLDMVRLGIATYGLWPSRETLVSARSGGSERLPLRPVLTWKTQVAQIKTVPAQSFIGYGCTFRTTHPTRLAILPVGYADGYDRRLSGVGHVLVRGRRAPVLGRVCMNMFMVDLTDIEGAAVGDEAVLLGKQGDEEISAQDLASLCQTIVYEIVTRIGGHLDRRVCGL